MGDFNGKDDDVCLYEDKYITVSAVKNDWNDYGYYDKFKKEDFNI